MANVHVMLVNKRGWLPVTRCGGDSFVMALLAQSEILVVLKQSKENFCVLIKSEEYIAFIKRLCGT